MPTIAPQTLLTQLSWRYATKKFDPTRKIDPETWSALEQAALLAPSSYGLQPWRMVIVTDPSIRVRLRAASFNQPQITDASHLVVFCRRTEMTAADVDRWIARIAEVRSVPRESLGGFREMMVSSVSNPAALPGGAMDTWIRSQVYISLGVFLASAAMLGVDACPMEGFNPAEYDAILDLPAKGYRATVLAAAGYRSAEDPVSPDKAAKVRFRASEVVQRV
jgi:nitroreductase